ncbi:hypothetical protein QYE76_034933 [Lolium multiflorum]|uniref:DUF8039 domain-containing protein n=1 Tax=Lolium multiflorum TaxID=4521 RepID=A0AAD8QZI7_LOLMU|nr:hypothetical protein QYE76_034933 [Lolium multiflorum]
MARGQAVDPALLNALAPLQSQPHRKSSVASSQQVDNDDDDDQVVEPPRYPPVDDLTESRPCELHVKVFNLSFKAAVGILLPTRSYHCRPVQDDFAVVMVDEVLREYEGLVLEHPAGEKPTSRPPPPPPVQSPPRDDSPLRDDDSPIHDQSPPRENTPPPPPPRQETPPLPPKQKRKRSAAPPTAPKRSSTPMRAQTPELLPHEQTEEQKAFLAPKKMFIPPQTVKHFAETRMKRPELRADYDRSLGQSSRASKEAKKVAQLGQQDIQAAPHFIVEPYHDPETASMIERAARAQGASVEYEDYYPTAQVVNKMKKLEYKRGKLLPLGFIDPNTVHEVTVRRYPKDTEDNIVMFLEKQADKEDIFFPYNFNFHFILLIIDLHLGVVNVMDSKRKEYAEWADMAAILQRAWKRFINTVPGEWKPELTFRDYPVDVYSFGVVLLELLKGARVSEWASDTDEDVEMVLGRVIRMLAENLMLDGGEQLWIADFIDSRLDRQFDKVQARTMVKLAVSCVEEDSRKRPTMENVVQMLLSVDEASGIVQQYSTS